MQDLAVIEDPESSHLPAVQVDWTDLVERIKSGDDSGMAELYQIFAKGIRFFLSRVLGRQEFEDKVHDIFVIVVQAIRRGHLREPDRLMGFVRTVMTRQVAGYIEQVVQSRRNEVDGDLGGHIVDGRVNPEQCLAFRQKVDLMKVVLNELSEKDRDVLVRYYLDEQTEAIICKDMNLSGNQFRLLKSRAKARFGELGKKRLQQGALRSIVMGMRKTIIQ